MARNPMIFSLGNATTNQQVKSDTKLQTNLLKMNV